MCPQVSTNLSLLVSLAVLVAACHAVFYTKSSEVDYPRIGRRSFYTTGRGNNYPRIGRRASVVSDSQTSALFPADDDDMPADAAAMQPPKRGFFTKASRFRSYPRVGRSQAAGDDVLPEDTGSADSFLEDQSLQAPSDAGEVKHIQVPLALLFLTYDMNGDGQLSKAEFVRGMGHYRQQNPLC